MRKICRRCGSAVKKEKNRVLRKEYPYYCPNCDENMYGFEVVGKRKSDMGGGRMKMSEEVIRKAVEWWADKVSGKQPHSNGDNGRESVMACIMADMGRKPVSNEQIEMFKRILSEKIREYAEERSCDFSIGCDYGPGILLAESADVAGINYLNFPFKTNMRIYVDGRVMVSDGYAKPYTEI